MDASLSAPTLASRYVSSNPLFLPHHPHDNVALTLFHLFIHFSTYSTKRDDQYQRTILATDTNVTFSSDICGNLTSMTSLVIEADPTVTEYFSLPACVNSSTIVEITAVRLNIDDLRVFPTAMTYMKVTQSRFIAGGFGVASGPSIDWSAFENRFKFLKLLDLSNCQLTGSLPNKIPLGLFSFSIKSNGFTGDIPSSLLSLLVSSTAATPADKLSIELSSNRFAVPIPESLFSGFSAQFSELYFDLNNNLLNGSIPATLFSPLINGQFLKATINLGDNRLEGSIPNHFLPSNMLDYAGTLVLLLTSNRFTGSLPESFIDGITSFGALQLSIASNNLMSGPLPEKLFSGGLIGNSNIRTLNIDMSSCGITGTIPSTFLAGTLTANLTIDVFYISLSSNQLTGAIPESLFRTESTSPLCSLSCTSVTIFLDNNQLGTLPSNTFHNYHPFTSYSLTLNLDDNPLLSGEIPSSLFEPFNLFAGQLVVSAKRTSISGSPPSACSSGLTTYDFNNAHLTGTILVAWASSSCGLQFVDLSHNLGMASTIPPGILNAPQLSRFIAAYASFTGTLPNTAVTLSELNLVGTKISFCSSSDDAFPPGSTTECNIDQTEACYCLDKYPNCVRACANYPSTVPPAIPASAPMPASPFSTPSPFSSPASTPSPFSTPPSVPPPPTPPVAPSCTLSTRPSTDFVCINGLWTAASVSNVSTLVIPSGAGTVVVVGNLTSPSLVFHGLGSIITVNGSINNLTVITIEFDPNQAQNLGGQKVLQILINTSGSEGASDLSTVKVESKVTSGCRKVKAEKVTFDGGKTLGVYLTLDKSKCNTWWIVLVSVVVAVIIIAAAVVVLLAVFYPPFRLKIRPYSGARKPTV